MCIDSPACLLWRGDFVGRGTTGKKLKVTEAERMPSAQPDWLKGWTERGSGAAPGLARGSRALFFAGVRSSRAVRALGDG